MFVFPGNVASLMSAEDENILILKEKRATIQNVICSRELPENIALKIRRHYEYAWKQKYVSFVHRSSFCSLLNFHASTSKKFKNPMHQDNVACV